ncbi:hypothetical protein [Enterocloster phage PMBT24]|uniref:Uncharacterized protein n=1 Tax=Enterocloster phage PMBT24 TaxID=3025413 RepID=A0AAT9TRD9_9CAUD|nr:hypothetical protein [Enterocloster phage PMBT24]DAL90029.1 MAG TPA: hypothetical protein [Caudoviricetes sp.]
MLKKYTLKVSISKKDEPLGIPSSTGFISLLKPQNSVSEVPFAPPVY